MVFEDIQKVQGKYKNAKCSAGQCHSIKVMKNATYVEIEGIWF